MAAPFDASSLLLLTENKSATYSASGDPCIDFFFQIVPDTASSKIASLLTEAWKQDPLTALKLVFNLRGVRGTGKSNKEAFYTCASWLYQHHSKTLLSNLALVPKFGYYKDLLEMVRRENEGADETEKRLKVKKALDAKIQAAKDSGRPKSGGKTGSQTIRRRVAAGEEKGYWARKGAAARQAKKDGVLQDKEVRVAANVEEGKVCKEKASQLRRQKRKDMGLRIQTKLKEDPKFTSLHDAVAQIFAKQLLADKKALESKKSSDISLAAKWCPSLQSSFDLRTGLHHAIAFCLFNKDEFVHLDEEKRALVVADKMRKEFLVPLRQALEVPEIYMSANRWGELPYERVTSVAMSNYVDHFFEHDSDRYVKFLEKVIAGKKKVAAGALLPHNVAKEAVRNEGKPKSIIAEAQWMRMVSDLKESGSKLSSSLAVCDVSGSMSGTPMEVSIALGLLVAELCEEPFKNHICTFSEEPQIHIVQGAKLAERYKFTQSMKWGMNTDFQKVFRALLDLALASNLPKEKMVKTIFVFSDMEFDEASVNPWETDYIMITKMFEEAGYGEPPEIVFWNLRDSNSTPVLGDQKGVSLVSGFSKNLLKVFLDENAAEEELEEAAEAESEGQGDEKKKKEKPKVDPKVTMMKALAGVEYEDIKIVD